MKPLFKATQRYGEPGKLARWVGALVWAPADSLMESLYWMQALKG